MANYVSGQAGKNVFVVRMEVQRLILVQSEGYIYSQQFCSQKPTYTTYTLYGKNKKTQ